MFVPPLILFGAFDRHNFGDLLLLQVAARQYRGRSLLYAGLSRRDLRHVGGVANELIAAQAAEWPAADLIHVGGEILGCTAYQAAVMLLEAEAVQKVLAQFDRDPVEREIWAASLLGRRCQLPYLIGRADYPAAGRIVCQSIGGVDFDGLPESARSEAISALRSVDLVRVRDCVTQGHLAAAGITVLLAPDPAVLVAKLFADEIARHETQGEVLTMSQSYPGGYLAVQFSADFGDDQTLRRLAGQLDALAEEKGFATVLFRAGLAPWHDDLAVYRRLAGFMKTHANLFVSPHLWDICALLSSAQAFVGSSLHGRIVAEAFGKPALNLLGSPSGSRKLVAYDRTWGCPGTTGVSAIGDVADVLSWRIHEPSGQRSEWQAELVRQALLTGVDRLTRASG